MSSIRSSKALSWSLRLMGLTGFCAIFFVLMQSCAQPKDNGLRRFAKDSLNKLEVMAIPPAQPELIFGAIDGTKLQLSDFRGKLILVNIWATWCAPCTEEMPSLDALQGQYGGDTFQVITISMDMHAVDGESFFATYEFQNLDFYHDPSLSFAGALGEPGLPISVFYSADGAEIARIAGPVDWQSVESRNFMHELLLNK